MAVRQLRRCGYQILRTNYSLEHIGEIDIIARDGGTLCFIEVKTRHQNKTHDISPAQAIDSKKRQRIAKCAKYFLKKYSLMHCPFRFDIAEVILNKHFWQHQIIIRPHAFGESSPKL
ncbi:YraN family protein [Lentisphaera profundi]|uniref:YraN family protein n=2 Tax=Lentisphaera profundi TaxID=1658616 RepID=A0ABY7VPD1_9BACT|nr:YraN family protein [Lentisphaera profundi]WDE95837.1 YraN family protein [Lentisphaera profundi]